MDLQKEIDFEDNFTVNVKENLLKKITLSTSRFMDPKTSLETIDEKVPLTRQGFSNM